jgi:hypothetical protein
MTFQPEDLSSRLLSTTKKIAMFFPSKNCNLETTTISPEGFAMVAIQRSNFQPHLDLTNASVHLLKSP